MGPVTIAVIPSVRSPTTPSRCSSCRGSEQRPGSQPQIRNATTDSTSDFESGQGASSEKRRRRQHVQGHREAGADWHGGGRRHHHGLRDHHAVESRTPRYVDKLSLVHPAALLGLLIGGAVIYWFTGEPPRRGYGRLPCVELHQGEHAASDATAAAVEDVEKSSKICTQYAQKGMFNIFLYLFFCAGVRLPRSVLLHRLPDLHRTVRTLPGHLHGECRRRVGQRQEGGGGGPEGEGYPAPRRHRGGRHGR